MSRLFLLDKTLRLGPARLKAGGIAGVFTEEPYRKRGYASACMGAALDRMVRRRYPLSLLYGIRDFYHRFDYASVFPVCSLTVSTEELLHQCPAFYQVRLFRKTRDARRLVNFCNQSNRERTGTAIRPANAFAPYSSRGKSRIILAENAQGRLLGHARWEFDEGALHVYEIEGLDGRALSTLANALARRAVRQGAREVKFWLLDGHPFVRFSFRFRSTYHQYHQRNAGAMARIIDLERFAESLLPALQQRWDQAGSKRRGALAVHTDLGRMCLALGPRGVRLSTGRPDWQVEMPQTALVQLAFGYRDLEDLSLDPLVRVPAPARELLHILFATHCWGSWAWDEF